MLDLMIAKIAAALQKDVVLRLMNYEDEVVIKPFIRQNEYWFHTTQKYDTAPGRITEDFSKNIFYEESVQQETCVIAEDSISYMAEEGA